MSNLPHVMLDLETLGDAPDGCIAQIGAVRFDPFAGDSGLISTPEGEFRATIRLETGLLHHSMNDAGKLDVDTVLWWMRQGNDARRRVFGADQKTYLISAALYSLAKWLYDGYHDGTLSKEPAEHIWASADYDFPILRSAYRRAGLRIPFTRKVVRDYRTLRWLGKALGIEEPIRVGVQHDALDDAHHQAIHAINILRAIKGLQ